MGTVRTMISLPGDLKKRMEKAGKKVNWSAVARSAFEKAIKDLKDVEEIQVGIHPFICGVEHEGVNVKQWAEDMSFGLEQFGAKCKSVSQFSSSPERHRLMRMCESAWKLQCAVEEFSKDAADSKIS